MTPTADDIITVKEVAEILRCKPSSVYNLTRRRSVRYTHAPIPVIRLPLGLRFRRSSVLAWLASLETTGVPAKI
jgi:predicted DNA-binding transcriptional regulator AlpA